MARLVGVYSLLAERLRQAREMERMNVSQFGRLVGIESRTISAYEHKKSRPSVEQLVRIAQVTHKPLRFFVEEDTDQVMLEVKYKDMERNLAKMNQDFIELKAILKKFGIDYDRKD